MNSVCINVEVEGTWCNHWPKLRLSVNDSIYFDNEINGKNNINITAPLQTNNKLIIQHYDKSFGQNGQWDTQSEEGKIVQDRAIILKSISLNDVDITKYILENCPLITDDKQVVYTDYIGFNGTIEVNFTQPVYDWIINTIVKPRSKITSDLIIETSYNNHYDYIRDLAELEELENILNENAYLFGKSSSL